MDKRKIYVDYIGGRFEAFQYDRGRKIILKETYHVEDVYAIAKRWGYKVVKIYGHIG